MPVVFDQSVGNLHDKLIMVLVLVKMHMRFCTSSMFARILLHSFFYCFLRIAIRIPFHKEGVCHGSNWTIGIDTVLKIDAEMFGRLKWRNSNNLLLRIPMFFQISEKH